MEYAIEGYSKNKSAVLFILFILFSAKALFAHPLKIAGINPYMFHVLKLVIILVLKQRHCIDIYSECHKEPLTSPERRIMSQPLLPL